MRNLALLLHLHLRPVPRHENNARRDHQPNVHWVDDNMRQEAVEIPRGIRFPENLRCNQVTYQLPWRSWLNAAEIVLGDLSGQAAAERF